MEVNALVIVMVLNLFPSEPVTRSCKHSQRRQVFIHHPIPGVQAGKDLRDHIIPSLCLRSIGTQDIR